MHDTDPGLARVPDSDPADTALTPEPVDAPEGSTGFSALRDEVTALVEDARTYAEAEVAFQKTRASLAGKHGARALVMLVLALVLLHIALIALAVGAVIALAPLVTIWGAIAIVVGVMLLGVALLVRAAMADGKLLGAMFGSGEAP
ncbi:phage holin family protein [Erythrobacter colymbi]|uniref:phage holin family protein n=1 Tax=Erythrobacter colymbi TaxID=1161202 RepID=UPI000A3CE370|nr:phage holin family protein [Erythrobacter colymbi]